MSRVARHIKGRGAIGDGCAQPEIPADQVHVGVTILFCGVCGHAPAEGNHADGARPAARPLGGRMDCPKCGRFTLCLEKAHGQRPLAELASLNPEGLNELCRRSNHNGGRRRRRCASAGS